MELSPTYSRGEIYQISMFGEQERKAQINMLICLICFFCWVVVRNLSGKDKQNCIAEEKISLQLQATDGHHKDAVGAAVGILHSPS